MVDFIFTCWGFALIAALFLMSAAAVFLFFKDLISLFIAKNQPPIKINAKPSHPDSTTARFKRIAENWGET